MWLQILFPFTVHFWSIKPVLRDRPFNLERGGYGFFVSFRIFFRTTRELEYLFFLSRKANFFSPEFNIRLYDKNSESDYFFFLHQNQNLFFSNIENQNIFLEKKHNPPSPPFKLNGRSLSNNLSYVIIFQCSLRRSHKTGLTVVEYGSQSRYFTKVFGKPHYSTLIRIIM
jgi:hypothetical protein